MIPFLFKFRHTQQRCLHLRKSLGETHHTELAFCETVLPCFEHHYQDEISHAVKVVTSPLTTEGIKQY